MTAFNALKKRPSQLWNNCSITSNRTEAVRDSAGRKKWVSTFGSADCTAWPFRFSRIRERAQTRPSSVLSRKKESKNGKIVFLLFLLCTNIRAYADRVYEQTGSTILPAYHWNSHNQLVCDSNTARPEGAVPGNNHQFTFPRSFHSNKRRKAVDGRGHRA